jgi:hypothetical protein
MPLTLTGASDDLIEVDGDFDAEFTAPAGGPALMAFSDGTVLRIEYTHGVWRIRPVTTGRGAVIVEQAPEDDEDNYSDKAKLAGPIEWVVLGLHMSPLPRGSRSGT